MLKAYKYRIYPDESQQAMFAIHFGHARHVYNWAYALKKKTYEETGKSISRRELQDLLVEIKKTEKPWLNDVNSQSLLAALFHLDAAYQNFFRGHAKYPKPRKKYSGHQSFQCPQHVSIDAEKSLLALPKIRKIKIKLHRAFSGKIKTVTISRKPSGKYFASILVETLETLPVKTIIEPEKTLGLDMGLTHYLIPSEGEKEQRNNFVHQLSSRLVFKNQETSFAIEDLHEKGMIRNRRLARSISDGAWRKFMTALRYKCDWSGKNVLTINRFAPSSKLCHACKRKCEKLPLSVRQWQCECGALHDRDINAARNIKAFALADALGHSVCVKQFPHGDNVQRRCHGERSGDAISLDGSQEAPTRTRSVWWWEQVTYSS